ncbi:DsbA family protein [Longimicrobium sp.]|uniref:DsbA family protein n=1 Tax=Longimicrobium sp. TaxID=2029185 RepID=UPI002F92FF58
MKITLSDVFTGILAVCALTVTGLVVKNEVTAGVSPSAARPEVKFLNEWRSVAREGTRLGRPDAPVQIIEFSDFQCPFCAQVQAAVRQVRERHPDEVTVVFRHFPLESIHPHAFTAATASNCAGDQGRFEAYHDALFASQDQIGTRPWEAFAREARVADLGAFRTCMSSGRHVAAVRRDADEAKRIGLRVTPTLIINGRGLGGATTADELEAHVRRALRDAGAGARAE